MTLLQVQEQYIETVNAGITRWSHRTNGGHASRISRGAYHKAEKQLRTMGFTEEQIKAVIKDARDMAQLIRNSEVDE